MIGQGKYPLKIAGEKFKNLLGAKIVYIKLVFIGYSNLSEYRRNLEFALYTNQQMTMRSID